MNRTQRLMQAATASADLEARQLVVARVAAELVSSAGEPPVRGGDATVHVDAEDFAELKEACRLWSDASQRFLDALDALAAIEVER